MGGFRDHSVTDLPQQPSAAYNEYGVLETKSAGGHAKWNPKNWRKRYWAAAAVVLIIVIVAAAVGGALGAKANRYPNYTPLNYVEQTTYAGSSFFNGFTYFNAPDPAEGVPIIYDNKIDAQNRNITGVNSQGHSYLQLNTTSPAANNAVFAHSARIVSNQTYDAGLFLFDIYHTPYGCATWPAVWLSDQSNWPTNGEIDIIEATNTGNRGVQSTLHSTAGCTMSGVKREESGTALQGDCLNSTNANAGCGVQGPVSSFGEAFNNANGGAYALEWRPEGIRVWFWPRATMPADVTAALANTTAAPAFLRKRAAAPDPSTWGEALADFPNTNCDIGSHFRNASLIANIDTCGQFAGATSVYSGEYGCPGTCAEYVAANPGGFGEAYWEFGAWKVYQSTGAKKARRALW